MTTPQTRVIVCSDCGRKWTSLDWVDPEKQKREHACRGSV